MKDTLPREVRVDARIAPDETAAFWDLVPRSSTSNGEPEGVHPVHVCSVISTHISQQLQGHFGGAPVIHLGQRLRLRQAIEVDQGLAAHGRITRITPRAAGVFLEISVRIFSGARHVLDSGALLLASTVAGASPDGKDTWTQRSGPTQVAGRAPVWQDHLRYEVTETDILRFAMCTGDGQPIHLSQDAAQDAGFPRVIAHGMHTVASCYQAAVDRAECLEQEVRSFTIRFARPVLVNTPVVVQVGLLANAVAVRATSRGRPLTRGGVAAVGDPSPPAGGPS